MTRPSSPELLAETARLAFHFHWPLDTLLDLEHRDRRTFLAQAEELAARSAPMTVEAPVPAGPPSVPAQPEPEPEPAVDLDAIKDPQVRKLFQTYYGGAA